MKYRVKHVCIKGQRCRVDYIKTRGYIFCETCQFEVSLEKNKITGYVLLITSGKGTGIEVKPDK